MEPTSYIFSIGHFEQQKIMCIQHLSDVPTCHAPFIWKQLLMVGTNKLAALTPNCYRIVSFLWISSMNQAQKV